MTALKRARKIWDGTALTAGEECEDMDTMREAYESAVAERDRILREYIALDSNYEMTPSRKMVHDEAEAVVKEGQ